MRSIEHRLSPSQLNLKENKAPSLYLFTLQIEGRVLTERLTCTYLITVLPWQEERPPGRLPLLAWLSKHRSTKNVQYTCYMGMWGPTSRPKIVGKRQKGICEYLKQFCSSCSTLKDTFSAATKTGSIPSAQLLVIVLRTTIFAPPPRGGLKLTPTQRRRDMKAVHKHCVSSLSRL